VARQGLPRLARDGASFPFVLLAPQCPSRTTWGDHLEALEALLDDASASLRADPKRVHLTGLSMGGAGAWVLAARSPARFASVVPICAPVPPLPGWPGRARRLVGVPVRAFHGAKDRVVPASEGLALAEALGRAGGDVRFVLVPEAGHEVWDGVYADPALLSWWAGAGRA
jgi:pimeloyl-ACP methyl ester carboxylesterase